MPREGWSYPSPHLLLPPVPPLWLPCHRGTRNPACLAGSSQEGDAQDLNGGRESPGQGTPTSVRACPYPSMRGVPNRLILPWCGWLTPPLPRRHCQHNRARPGARGTAGEEVGMRWHTFARSAPSPADSACCPWECLGQHRVGPGAQHVPGPRVLQPRNCHGRVCAGHSAHRQGEAVRTRAQLEHPGEPGCEHGTSTWLRCQQPIAKQMPPYSPSPRGCNSGGFNETQPLLEPLWPMQTGMCNESISP